MKNNFIEVYKNALSKKSCDYIINCFDKFKEKTYTGMAGVSVEKDIKDSLDFNLLEVQGNLEDFLFNEIKVSLKTHVGKYMEKYKLAYGVPLKNMWDHFSIFPWAVHAKKYKKDNPKYIELYSKKPPNIAPNILDDKAFGTELIFNNSLEKARPENNIGNDKKIGTI